MAAPAKILDLVKRFNDNADDYRAPQYSEAQTRIEFINPLFECLGWDIESRRGAAERFKDVIHEAALKMGGATKAPDYCFRQGGTRWCSVEAKDLGSKREAASCVFRPDSPPHLNRVVV